MVAIATTTSQGSGQRTAVTTNLTASDTFAYTYGLGQLLILRSGSGVTINVTIIGDDVVNFTPQEIGVTVNAVGGCVVPVGALDTVVINLDEQFRMLSPTNTITGGTGLSAILTL